MSRIRSRSLWCGVAAALSLFVVTAAFQVRAGTAETTTLPHVAARIAAGEALRIVAFGSSSTEGVGASTPAASYPSQLERALSARVAVPVRVLNRGIGGEDADDMARRLPTIVAEHPDLVIWQTGSNDPLRDLPLPRFIELTRAGIAALQAAGIDVMMMEPQFCERLEGTIGADAYRTALRQVAEAMGVPDIRRFDLMRQWLKDGLITRTGLLSPDGLHMADAGYAMLAAEVAREIIGPPHQPFVADTVTATAAR